MPATACCEQWMLAYFDHLVYRFAEALWNVLAEWVKKGDKEKFGPEPYVEREDMQGTLKWRQMQKNGALVPDQFYRR